jgi:hypothetical protein
MQKNFQEEGDLPQDFDVEEVSDASDEADTVVYAGHVEPWEIVQFAEKAKARSYITGIVISIWAIGIIASAIKMFLTGNLLLLVPPALVSVPMYIVLRFYFRSG